MLAGYNNRLHSEILKPKYVDYYKVNVQWSTKRLEQKVSIEPRKNQASGGFAKVVQW